MKSYCGKCKFYDIDSMYERTWEHCLSNPVTRETYFGLESWYAAPSVKNMNNDCDEFRLKKPGIFNFWP